MWNCATLLFNFIKKEAAATTANLFKPEISSSIYAFWISQTLTPSKLIDGLPNIGDILMAYLISADEAAEFANRANFAAQQARSVSCMVEVDLEELWIRPVSPKFRVEIELIEPENILLDPSSGDNQKVS